ncbi:hypothetical protein Sbal223_1642 [Shewanella baltica OS223]|uniref:hypothetical protein n=1 Tax=Shewanella baltica TaxID=62322 RepID=UPI0001883DFD|nr:hypothetical protein [Shewanella baltica]ACK46147.1 hypothetical protein Sbal223_1642 [Shewanella baltica OS223]
MLDMVKYAAIGWGAISLTWLALMLVIRHVEFSYDEVRSNGNRSDEIKYHNEAIYRDFEYFFKVTLAIVGGISYVASRESVDKFVGDLDLILEAAGFLQLMTTLILFLFIVFHQKSKIARWKDRFSWWAPFFWQEYWICSFMCSVSAALVFGLMPNLIK